MSSILSPHLTTRSNSACEISYNDGSLNIVPDDVGGAAGC